MRRREERERGALDEADDHDEPERRPVRRDRDGEDGNPKSANGRRRANPTAPAFAAEPVTASTSGYATNVSWLPTLESSWPLWSSIKSRFRYRGTADTG
jgi:hypothetical protein